MKRKPNTVGGGSQTNKNGLLFERTTDLVESFNNLKNYHVEIYPYKEKSRSGEVFKNRERIGYFFEQNSIYKRFLEPKGIDVSKLVSSKLKPDSVFINLKNNTIYIIEKKYQNSHGSVDEKLQTCDYKKQYYKKIFHGLLFNIKFYYILNDWFRKPQYEDVFNYIDSVGCKKFINLIPFDELGIQ